MTVLLGSLPGQIAEPCVALREGLTALLGDELVSLWVYGAVTFPDRPVQFGDVDTHGVLASSPSARTAAAIDDLHASTAGATGIEWDSWYILESDASRVEPPLHAFRDGLRDRAWALHRAHWLAGQYVPLHGRLPQGLIPPPDWSQLEEALASEITFIGRVLAEERLDEQHYAFAVWNSCRVIYSLRTRDVVVSKRAAARWALRGLADRFHPAIVAAGRAYDGSTRDGDLERMSAVAPELAAEARRTLLSPDLGSG